MSTTLRYRCLLTDHDDTAVDSTPTIHHPAHLEALRLLRPHRVPPTLEDWYRLNLDPGISEYLNGVLGLDGSEMATAIRIWQEWTDRLVPRFFPGFLDLLQDYRRAGGRVAVISHSERAVILRHYQATGDQSHRPDAVYGWDDDAARRKPDPWPARDALRALGCAPEEALVLDDLKPGVVMARACGLTVAAAGWAHRVAEVERYMRSACDVYLPTIDALRGLIFR